jgi:catechol 2,3-dioxygenase-like lactoylglutathione lyase family enzyme
MTTSIKRLEHVGIKVRDIGRAVAFYTRDLGMHLP